MQTAYKGGDCNPQFKKEPWWWDVWISYYDAHLVINSVNEPKRLTMREQANVGHLRKKSYWNEPIKLTTMREQANVGHLLKKSYWSLSMFESSNRSIERRPIVMLLLCETFYVQHVGNVNGLLTLKTSEAAHNTSPTHYRNQ